MGSTGELNGYAASDMDFFKQSHLNISKLPPLDAASSSSKKERSQNYWRIHKHVTIENATVDPKIRGISRITTKKQNKTLYGTYPQETETKMHRQKTSSQEFKLPSLDTKLGSKSIYWHWNSLSEDLRKGRVLNFHQLNFDLKKAPPAYGSEKPSDYKWHRASSKYNYKLSPRYHLQFLEDVHQTRVLGWKGNTKTVKSSKPKLQDVSNEEDDLDTGEEFEAALNTNISGLDNNLSLNEDSGADNFLVDLSVDEDTKHAGQDESRKDADFDAGDLEAGQVDEEELDDGEENGLEEIEEIPEPDE